jgi:Flp pilus assembly protein TadG
MNRLTGYLRSEHGASTVEFVLVLPILLLIVFGMIQFGMLLYTAAQLHWTVEDAARCASVRLDCRVGGVSTGLVTRASVETYARSRYSGLAPGTFIYDDTLATGTCGKTPAGVNNGKRVSATADFNFNVGVFATTVPLNATACFP